jgi:Fe-S cluster assembly protein SufD
MSTSTIAEVSEQTGFSREGVEAVSRAHIESGASHEARLRAWDLYESLPMPQRTEEEWRRTDIRALKLDRLRPHAGLETAGVDPLVALEEAGVENAAAQIALGPNAGVIVQRDASTILATLDPEVAAKGVIFTDLATAVRDYPELVERYFMTQAVKPSLGKFEALHAAYWQGGLFLYVPKGVTVDAPFRSFSVISESGAAVFAHTLAVLEEGAEAFVVDAFRSPSQDVQSFASAVVELIVGDDAKLRYVQVQDWGRNVWNFMTERAILGNDSLLNSLHVTLGSRFSKSSIAAHLRGKNSLAEMLGIFFADGDQFFDHHTWQLHESPYTTSDLEFKGALKGNARSVYSGLIKVSEGAQKTDAYQQNRNLILSRTARADSIPNLEIAANDVRCTHGATVSQVEEEHLFYLQARGIPRSEAQKLIVEGFFRPVIDRIPVEEIQDFLEGAIARKVGI